MSNTLNFRGHSVVRALAKRREDVERAPGLSAARLCLLGINPHHSETVPVRLSAGSARLAKADVLMSWKSVRQIAIEELEATESDFVDFCDWRHDFSELLAAPSSFIHCRGLSFKIAKGESPIGNSRLLPDFRLPYRVVRGALQSVRVKSLKLKSSPLTFVLPIVPRAARGVGSVQFTVWGISRSNVYQRSH